MAKKTVNKAIKVLTDKMQYFDLYDSYGVILLKNGAALQIRHFFDYFLDTWQAYKVSSGAGDTKAYKEIMADTGGIISNGEMFINLDDIATMVAIHEMKDADKDHPIPLDDYIHLMDEDKED